MIDRWLAAILLACLLLALPARAQLTPAEERGRAIYFGEQGSALDDATARIGGMGVKLPAQSFPCASCHGRAGIGVAERGAVPSDLSRGALTRPYTVIGERGRKRPPYTLAAFRTAVRSGRDPGGSELADAMPRFDLARRDLDDLWAYLAVMDQLSDPGLSEQHVDIGVVLSGSSRSGEAQRLLLEALRDDINRIGGIHGRRLRFSYHAPGNLPDEAVFAAIVLSRDAIQLPERLPVVATSLPDTLMARGFAILASTADQAAALRQFAVREFGVLRIPDACEPAASDIRLMSSPACLGGAGGAARLLLPYPVFAAIPPAERRRLPAETYVALPAPLGRVAPQAQAAFARTRAKAGTGRETILAEAEAYSAAAVMIESLMRAGHSVDREGLVSALEGLVAFEGAITPPLSFGPNRHTGSRGAEIVRYSPETGIMATAGTWIDPDAR